MQISCWVGMGQKKSTPKLFFRNSLRLFVKKITIFFAVTDSLLVSTSPSMVRLLATWTSAVLRLKMVAFMPALLTTELEQQSMKEGSTFTVSQLYNNLSWSTTTNLFYRIGSSSLFFCRVIGQTDLNQMNVKTWPAWNETFFFILLFLSPEIIAKNIIQFVRKFSVRSAKNSPLSTLCFSSYFTTVSVLS